MIAHATLEYVLVRYTVRAADGQLDHPRDVASGTLIDVMERALKELADSSRSVAYCIEIRLSDNPHRVLSSTFVGI